MRELINLAAQFSATINDISPLGHGLINDTYLVSSSDKQFVLQRLNKSVFTKPAHIIENLAALNSFVIDKDTQLQLPQLIKTIANQSYYKDEQDNYWRALSYINNSQSFLSVTNLEQAKQIGFALGHFHRLFSGLDTNLLHTTLADFHITPLYLKAYQQIAVNKTDNAVSAYCAAFIANHQAIAIDLEQAKQQGLLKLRVIHGDPKADNFLFELNSHKILSLIDLDTVQAGLVHYDIGDCVRSCCQTQSGEFDLDFCHAILSSYLSEAQHFFNQADYDFLYQAIRLLPFELGLRFYTDYLKGNVYFKVKSPEQNLHRAAEQFHLCQSIIDKEVDIRSMLQGVK
jgi:Ser/Thr protein kinase RdoA (MazF antagonist)